MPSWRRIVAESKYTRSHTIRSVPCSNSKIASVRQMNARPVGGQAAEAAVVGAQQVELDDHRVLGVVHLHELVALVRKRRAGLLEIAP